MTDSTTAVLNTKSHLVKEVFEDAPRYLSGRRYDIWIRAETVKTFADQFPFERALDIGCGDGSISLPLTKSERKMTLIDFSGSMTTAARTNVPRHLTETVEIRTEDFMQAPFEPASFDLIICMGVMAHVDSTEELIAKITTLLKPGGRVILEFTDAYHLVSLPGRLMRRLRQLICPPRYAVNLLSSKMVASLLDRHRLQPISIFRYALPHIPFLTAFMSPESRYRFVRLLFGNCLNNRNKQFGNEYVCCLTLKPSHS